MAPLRRWRAACPRCGRRTWQVHQWRQQRKRDEQLWGKAVYVLLWKRRFRCRPCRTVFTEADPVCGRRRRTTCRLRRRIARQSEEAPVRAVSPWHGVSEGLVQRSWAEQLAPPRTGPHVLLGLDGFCVRRPGAMWTGLWDLQTRNPVAVVASERVRDVQTMLERSAPRATV